MSRKHEQPAPPKLIVGIGASAGGLEAFTTFFAHLPADSGMAFVLVQHLSPDHKSMLAEILARDAPIPVVEAEHRMRLEPNRVHVIPPDSTLTIEGGRLHVIKSAPPRSSRRPIDSFFTSLAADQSDNAVAIVLSGVGSDGSVGLAAVKDAGGLTIAQAEFDHHAMPGMPQSAAATGLVDYVLQVEEMPAKLIEHRDHLALVADLKDGDGVRNDAAEHLTGAPEPRLKLSWVETGGPRIAAPPAQRGFGTTLIERSMNYEWDAEVDRSFAESGVVCTIEMPLTPAVGELRTPEPGGVNDRGARR